MQPRAYDSASQAIDRVVRSILSWEACEMAASEFRVRDLMALLSRRQTAQAEDLIRHAVIKACQYFDEIY